MSVICFEGNGAKKGRDGRYSLTPFHLTYKRVLTLPKRLLHQRRHYRHDRCSQHHRPDH